MARGSIAPFVDFALSDEQEDFRAALRALFAKRSKEADVRETMETDQGLDLDLWRQLVEIGVVALVVGEEDGGLGPLPVELSIAMEEAGRVLATVPILSTAVLAAETLGHCACREARERLLPDLLEGGRPAALALAEPGAGWALDAIAATARRRGEDWVLDGIKTEVVDGEAADVLLVVARDDLGLALFEVDPRGDGVECRPTPTFDQTRRQAEVLLVEAAAVRISAPGDAGPGLERSLGAASIALAAEHVGAASTMLDLTAEYARVREQFGRPIGSFQAIKAICAEMMLELEAARAAAFAAASLAAAGDPSVALVAHLAKARAGDALEAVTAAAIQVHGGVGFTWEHPAHLYYKRARAGSHLLGGAAGHHRALAEGLVA